MDDRGRNHYRVLVDAGVAIRTMGRLLNVHRSNIRGYGEGRGFNRRHWPRLELAAHLVKMLPSNVPADPWLKTPHPGLDGRTPVDLVSAHGADAPITKESVLSHVDLRPMRRRWWVTWLALLEVPGGSPAECRDHLASNLPQPGSDGDEKLVVDVRWAWTPNGYDTTFVVAEVGALLWPGLSAERRWDPRPDCSVWFNHGEELPLREALLTHWHENFDGAYVALSLQDTPVPVDIYDQYMFNHRKLVRPSSPPWNMDEEQPVLRYLRRLAAGGPRLPRDYWPFPDVRNGTKAEMWTLWRPFTGEEPVVYSGRLHRYTWERVGLRQVNTAVRTEDHEGSLGDPRAVRLIRHPHVRP